MIRPRRRRIIGAVARRTHRNAPVRLTSSTLGEVLVGHPHHELVPGDPAFATSTSTGP